MKWPWQWTAAEQRAFWDFYLGVVINRTTFQVIAGIVVGVPVVLFVLGQCNSPDPFCDAFAFHCIPRGGSP